MKKYRWYWPLTTAALVVLMGSAGGCIATRAPEEEAQPVTRPVISYFTATPETISPGETVTLSWDVSDATSVAIDPTVGSTSPSGSVQLSPAASTTYALTATNAAGEATDSVTVTVTAAATGKPDLVITDIWLTGGMVYYKMKNQGSADAKSSQSDLYVGGLKEASDYTETLAAGEERTASFSNWPWPFALPSGPGVDLSRENISQFNVKVCADGNNAVDESAERNNCTTEVWGPTLSYDFVEKAHLAEWRSGAGRLKWPMVASNRKGAAFLNPGALEDGKTYAYTLATYPEQSSHGSIQGTFGESYSKLGETRIGEMEVPDGARFTALVGFKEGATATDGVTVAFGYVDPSGSVIFFQELDVYYDGLLDVYEVDLISLAGQKVYFIMRVEAGESWEQDWLVWVDPKIVPAGQGP